MNIVVRKNISCKLKNSTSEIGYYSYTNRYSQLKKLNLKSGIDISILEEQFERKQQRFLNLQSKDIYFKNCKLFIWEYYQIKGWYETLVNFNIEEAKQAFFNAGKTDIYYYQLFKHKVSDLFSYGRTHVLETSLSDSIEVMTEYSKINYQLNKHGRKLVWYTDMVNDGEGYIYCDLISKAMTKNYSELERLIGIVKTKSLKLKKNQWLNLDINFFDGILENNTDKVYKTILQLCTKEHKKRNKHSFFYKELVSHPAQGYLKIAWINALEIEIENKFIHNGLIPIVPNKVYKDEVGNLEHV